MLHCRKYTKYLKSSDELGVEEQMENRRFHHERDTVPRKSIVVIEIANKPTFRLLRDVSFSRLDFVVAIGSIIGLFFGASLLSLVEIIYMLIFRRV